MQTIINNIASSVFGHHTSLRRQIIINSQWLIVRSLFLAALDIFIKAYIFRRALDPQTYGLFIVAMMIIGLFESLSVLGIDILIQRDQDDYQPKLPTYWTVNFCRGIFLTLLLFLTAPYLATFFQAPHLTTLIRTMGLSFLLRGGASFGREIYQRQMHFLPVVITDAASSCISITGGIVMIFVLPGPWVLASCYLFGSAAYLVSSYILYPWKPHFAWDRKTIKAVIIFGSSIAVLNFFTYLFSNFDQALIAKFINPTTLAYYAGGYFLASIPVQYIANAVTPVLLPALRNLQHDRQQLRIAFLKSLIVMAIIVTISALTIAFVVKYFVITIWSAKWLPVLPYCYILLIFSVAKGIANICPTIFFLLRRPWINTSCAGFSTLLMVGVCYPLVSLYGAYGAAIAVVAGTCCSTIITITMAFYVIAHK